MSNKTIKTRTGTIKTVDIDCCEIQWILADLEINHNSHLLHATLLQICHKLELDVWADCSTMEKERKKMEVKNFPRNIKALEEESEKIINNLNQF